MTLTVASCEDVTVGFERLSTVRRRFERLLKSDARILGYVVAAELTWKPSAWHWHLHVAVLGNDLESLMDLPELWVDTALQLGVRASIDAVVKDAEETLGYVVKGKLGFGSDSLRGLLERAAQGEADAVDAWMEMEAFVARGHRWLFTYKMYPLSGRFEKRTPRHSDTCRGLMMLADIIGATSTRVQEEIIRAHGWTFSRSTINRIRRDDPLYRRWREIGPKAPPRRSAE